MRQPFVGLINLLETYAQAQHRRLTVDASVALDMERSDRDAGDQGFYAIKKKVRENRDGQGGVRRGFTS